MAAMMMEADAADIEFKDGQYRVVGTDKAIAIVDVAKAAYAPMGPLTVKFGVGLEASGSHSAEPPSHPNGSHVCELEVDPDTGEVTVDRYFVVDDLGRVLNPMIVRGQIHGGVIQGIGQALIEHQIYDRQSGQLLTGSFMDYGMPRADMMPERRCDAGRGAVQDQSARRQGHRRVRHHRRAADRHQRADRRAQAARRPPHRHAGDTGAGVGNDPACAGRRAGWTLTVGAMVAAWCGSAATGSPLILLSGGACRQRTCRCLEMRSVSSTYSIEPTMPPAIKHAASRNRGGCIESHIVPLPREVLASVSWSAPTASLPCRRLRLTCLAICVRFWRLTRRSRPCGLRRTQEIR